MPELQGMIERSYEEFIDVRTNRVKSAFFAISWSPSVATAITIPPRAFTSSMFESILSRTTIGSDRHDREFSSIKAIGRASSLQRDSPRA